MENVKERLVDTAEALIQRRGYNGFSYRDIAAEVGIRAASIHYHFPTKADLGAQVAARYTDRFMNRLAAAEAKTDDASRLLAIYVAMFKATLEDDRRMCLCGILAAEIAALPEAVATAARLFFEANLNWLTLHMPRRSEGGTPHTKSARRILAAHFLASLEGAMIVAKGLDDPKLFDQIAAEALDRLKSSK